MSEIELSSEDIFQLSRQNKLAQEVINKYAKKCVNISVGFDVVGVVSLLLPVTTSVARLATVSTVYNPMVKELAEIYSSSPNDTKTLVAEFDSKFLQEIAEDHADYAVKVAGATIGSLLGIFANTALVFTLLAVDLVWQVGVMTMIYFANGEEWIKNKKYTSELVWREIGDLSLRVEDKVKLDTVIRRIPELKEKILRNLVAVIRTLDATNPDELRKVLKQKGIDDELLIEEALVFNLRAKRTVASPDMSLTPEVIKEEIFESLLSTVDTMQELGLTPDEIRRDLQQRNIVEDQLIEDALSTVFATGPTSN